MSTTAPAPATTTTGAPLPLVSLPQGERALRPGRRAGSMMAGRAEHLVGDPAVVSAAAGALAGDVLAVIDAHR